MAFKEFVGRNGIIANNILAVSNTTAQTTITPTTLTTNSVDVTNTISTGNSTVNAIINSTSLTVGTTVVNTSSIAVANIAVTNFTSTGFIANSSGGFSPTTISVGNSTVNVSANSTMLKIGTSNVSVVGHGHGISDVSGLQTALDGKQPLATNLTSWAGIAPSAKQNQSANLDSWSGIAPSAKADASHTQAISTITSLQSTLDTKLTQGQAGAILTFSSAYGDFWLPAPIKGGIGSGPNAGGAYDDWNHVDNIKSGFSRYTVPGSGANGPGADSNYYHLMNVEYSSKDGSGNMTQIGIPYHDAGGTFKFRFRYSDAWSSYYYLLDSRHWAGIADYRTKTSGTKALNPSAVWGAVAEYALTDGATITPDLASGINFSVLLGGNRTLANPTNIAAGQRGRIRIVQDGTGSRTLAYGSLYKWAGGTVGVLSTTAGATDYLDYDVIDGSLIRVSLSKAWS